MERNSGLKKSKQAGNPVPYLVSFSVQTVLPAAKPFSKATIQRDSEHIRQLWTKMSFVVLQMLWEQTHIGQHSSICVRNASVFEIIYECKMFQKRFSLTFQGC